jgi:hypothetical protein
MSEGPETKPFDSEKELIRFMDGLIDERDRILTLIEETAQRYSRGSVTRVALDNLALEIRERS